MVTPEPAKPDENPIWTAIINGAAQVAVAIVNVLLGGHH
jgi:hypothetical protein